MKRIALLSILLLAAAATAQVHDAGNLEFQASNTTGYGYDYSEDLQEPDAFDPGSSGSHFVLPGYQSDFSYAAAHLTGARAYETVLCTEAHNDSATSGVAPFFSFHDGTLDKGDGKTAGDFADGVKLKFLEDGTEWSVSAYENRGGGETKLGATVKVPGGSNPSTYRFIVDLDEGKAYLTTDGGATIMERSLSSQAQAQSIHKHYLVGYGNRDAPFALAKTSIKYTQECSKVFNVDPQPPSIASHTYSPVGPLAAGTSPTITAQVSDDWGGVTVQGIYTLNSGAEQILSATLSAGTYTATFPAAPAGADYQVWLRATDEQGLESEGPRIEWAVDSGDAPSVEEPMMSGGGDRRVVGDHSLNLFLAAGVVALLGFVAYALNRQGNKRRAVQLLIAGLAIAALLALLGLAPGFVAFLVGLHWAVYVGVAALVGLGFVVVNL